MYEWIYMDEQMSIYIHISASFIMRLKKINLVVFLELSVLSFCQTMDQETIMKKKTFSATETHPAHDPDHRPISGGGDLSDSRLHLQSNRATTHR